MYCFLHFSFINVIIFVNNRSRSYSTFVGTNLEYPILLSYITSNWSELRYFNFEPCFKLWWCRARDFEKILWPQESFRIFKEVFKFWNFKSSSFCLRHHLHQYVQYNYCYKMLSKTTISVYWFISSRIVNILYKIFSRIKLSYLFTNLQIHTYHLPN